MKKYLRKLSFVMLVVLIACSFVACGNSAINLEKPQNVDATYDGNGNAYVSWGAVENATQYEVYFDGKLVGTGKETKCKVNNVEEGKSHTIKVIATAFKKDEKFSSEVAECNLDIPIMLGKLDTIRNVPNGSRFYLDWDDIEGASFYEVKLSEDGEIVSLTDSYVYINEMKDGQQLDVYIRPVRKIGNYIYNEDWSRFELSFPTYQYDKLPYEYAIDLDLERLKYWAKSRGYEVDVTKSDGITFADVHFKDGNNSGLAKGLGRFLGSLIEGYLTAAAGSAQQTYNSDFSDIDNMVSAFVGAGGIENYVEEKEKEIQTAGKAGAVAYGLTSLLTDTDIHYVYRYCDTRESAVLCESYMLNMNNESYFENRYKNCEKGADGYYHLQTSTDYPIRIYTGVKFIENFDYNVTVIGYDN